MDEKNLMAVKAFVSSTFRDLKDHRAYVIERLGRGGIFVDPMEKWTAASDEPKSLSQERVRDCDLCILLVGFRRGHIPENESFSITQLEYREALRREIDILVFMASTEASWPEQSINELTNDPEMIRWRSELSEKFVISQFNPIPESVDVDSAMIRWFDKRNQEKVKSNSGKIGSLINPIEICTFSNLECILIAWKTSQPIKGCLGFAIHRKILDGSSITESILESYVGFTDISSAVPKSSPSTEHPIQKFRWIDRPPKEQEVRYRVVPVMGKPGSLGEVPEGEGSGWSRWISRKTSHNLGFQLFFNNYIGFSKSFIQVFGIKGLGSVKTKVKKLKGSNSAKRNTLGGELRQSLLSILLRAKLSKQRVYICIQEIDDEDIFEALENLGKNLSVIIYVDKGKHTSNTTHSKNLPSKLIKILKVSSANIYTRQIERNHSIDQNFAVFCDQWGSTSHVWIGTTKWTTQALCMNENYGMVIESASFAREFLDKWENFRNLNTKEFMNYNSMAQRPVQIKIEEVLITIWNNSINKIANLGDAGRLINGARQGILFLMKENLITKYPFDTILNAQMNELFIQGLTYTTTNDSTFVNLHDIRYNRNIRVKTDFPIDSSMVVIDPFGPHPAIILDTSNPDIKSGKNKSGKLLIIENAPGLAIEFIIHLIRLYDNFHYRNLMTIISGPTMIGLKPNDRWQDRFFGNIMRSESNFLFGSLWPGL